MHSAGIWVKNSLRFGVQAGQAGFWLKMEARSHFRAAVHSLPADLDPGDGRIGRALKETDESRVDFCGDTPSARCSCHQMLWLTSFDEAAFRCHCC